MELSLQTVSVELFSFEAQNKKFITLKKKQLNFVNFCALDENITSIPNRR